MDMKITTKDFAGITVVYLAGELGSTTSGQVMDDLVGRVKGGANRIVLNLEDLTFLSSAGIRSILVAAKLLQNADGEMRICNASESVRKVLETTGFTSLVKLDSDESHAVSSFRRTA